MASLKVGENKEINTDLIQKACSLAVKAHSKSSQKSYIREKTGGSSYVIFSFPGYWSKNDWYDGESFGETKINIDLFPPLKSIGIDEHAQVNKAFQQRFVDKISTDQDFINKVHFVLSLFIYIYIYIYKFPDHLLVPTFDSSIICLHFLHHIYIYVCICNV